MAKFKLHDPSISNEDIASRLGNNIEVCGKTLFVISSISTTQLIGSRLSTMSEIFTLFNYPEMEPIRQAAREFADEVEVEKE